MIIHFPGNAFLNGLSLAELDMIGGAEADGYTTTTVLRCGVDANGNQTCTTVTKDD